LHAVRRGKESNDRPPLSAAEFASSSLRANAPDFVCFLNPEIGVNKTAEYG
jgi:hypothetical protein